MNVTTRLVGFALALVVAFALGFGVGELAGPFGDTADTPTREPHQMESM